MGRLIRVFEYEKLTAKSRCTKGQELGTKIIDRLWQYNDAHDNKYFEAIRHGVKFKNYVGVIQIGETTIEILPKTDKNIVSDTEEKEIWHHVLLKMLAQCKKVKVNAVSQASLKKKYHSLLDLYFELFVDEVNGLLQRGLVKNYNQKSKNIGVLKGRLLFEKNLQQNLIRQDRFYTAHQVYDYNHLINQILLKAIHVLKNISNNTYLLDSINRILLNYPEVQYIEISKAHFDKIVLNRKNTPYAEALKIAKMLILNYSPDIKGGDENMLALLFDMNKLWEEYIFRMLQKHENANLSVSFQNRDKFWENKIIKPDIVLTKKTESDNEMLVEHFIIDTKWKVMDKMEPDDEDLKQIYAYNMYWGSEKSMLLYPSSKQYSTKFGRFHKGRSNENQCKLGFVKVMNTNTLNLNIGEEILQMLGVF